jgi:hypothetical protein
MRFRFGFILLYASLFVQTVRAQNPLSSPAQVAPGNYTVIELLQLLQSQGAQLAYSVDLLPANTITVSNKLVTVNDALNILKKQSGIQFTTSGNLIMLSYLRKMYTISGTITDANTGEALIGSTVVLDGTTTGTTTNAFGFYSITLPEGTYPLTFRFVGYTPITQEIVLTKNQEVQIKLNQITERLPELTIQSITPDFNIQNLVPGVTPISFGANWPIPYFLGEEDIFQNSLLLPGIRSIGEDATGLNIRGGDIDQNLILLDGAPIYNPNHFYGLISVFSPEVVNSVEIMRGYIPPQYGGRASSVIDIIQREGNNQEFHLSGGMGLVSGRLTAEGPIERGKSSYLISARRSLVNFSIEDFINQSLDNSRTNFQDFNAKLNWNLNDKNKLYLSAYYGQDRNRAGFDAIRRWGNRSFSLRWNHIFNPRLFSNFTGVISEYTYQISDPQEVGSFIGKSSIRNFTAKSDFGYIINPRHSLDFGIHTTFHKLKPGQREPFDANDEDEIITLDFEDAIETAIYISHTASLGDRVTLQYGMRYSGLLNFGPGNAYKYANDEPKSDETITDTLSYRSGQVSSSRNGFEPRISLNYLVKQGQSLKLAFSRTYQYIHLISNTVAPSPTDIWKLSDKNIAPYISDQISMGYYRNLADNRWESSVEVYTKWTANVLDFIDGADLLFNENLETELIAGRSLAYGAEFFLKRNTGKLRGWLSYTWSNAQQQYKNKFESIEINNGNYFPSDFDKRHDVSITTILSLSKRVSLSSNINYSTGRPVTLPVGKFVLDDKTIPQYDLRNQGRLPDYHRLDLSLRVDGRTQTRSGNIRKNQDSWIFTLYNVYARRNIYSYLFRESPTNPGELEVISYSIFGTIIPSVTYNFRF